MRNRDQLYGRSDQHLDRGLIGHLANMISGLIQIARG